MEDRKQVYENIRSKKRAELVKIDHVNGIEVYVLKHEDEDELDKWCYRDFSLNWVSVPSTQEGE